MFLNSLEKKVGEEQLLTAQVSISGSEGEWIVLWQESEAAGQSSVKTWYEGASVEEMLSAFRTNIFNKQTEGFKPVLDVSIQPEPLSLDKRSVQIRLLHYYSELNVNRELYEQLRQWRLKQANKEAKAPFLVATNRMLQMITAFLPHTPEELQQLPGMGAGKVAAYGGELLAMVQSYERSTSFPLNWVESMINPSEFHAWLQSEKDRKTRAEQNKQEIKRKLLEAITRGDDLEAVREQMQLHRRELLLRIEELDRDGYDLEAYVEQMLQNIPDDQQSLAWSAFQLQGDRYLKPILHSLYTEDELAGKEVDRIYEWLRLLRIKFRRAQSSDQAAAV
ncbi:HRDC domain-containing protein [Paenibacillus xerothermodurans]|nr:HRDC domain-containing protein [Paenibacillus xerothermodurans]